MERIAALLGCPNSAKLTAVLQFAVVNLVILQGEETTERILRGALASALHTLRSGDYKLQAAAPQPKRGLH